MAVTESDDTTLTASTEHAPLNLQDLKDKKPEELLALGEELGIDNASVLRKQDLMFAILKERADEGATP